MSRPRRRRPGPRPDKFWGAAAPVPIPEPIAPGDDPSATVASLGPPPLGAHSGPGEYYLAEAYRRASGVAIALAAAAGLLEVPGPDHDDPFDE